MLTLIRDNMFKIIIAGTLALALGAAALVAVPPQKADAITVGDGVSWNYGCNAGVYAFSSVFTSKYWHSATVVNSNGTPVSVTKQPGEQAYADMWVAPWDRPAYYWNAW